MQRGGDMWLLVRRAVACALCLCRLARAIALPSSELVFHRKAALGDFEELNQLLRNAVIRLPDLQVSKNLITIDITNLRCQGFQVGDVLLNANRDASRVLTLDVEVQDLDLSCYFDYEYRTFAFRGSGSANVFSSENDANLIARFSSNGSSSSLNSVPTEANTESCDPRVNIDDLNFEGGILGIVLDRIESMLRGTLERQAEELICDKLTEMITTGYVKDFLNLAKETLSQYTPDLALMDPLNAERELKPPKNDSQLLNFRRQETDVGLWLDKALNEAFLYLGKRVEIGNGDETDMNVNVVLRDSFLQNGAFNLDVSDLSLTDGVLWSGHDRLSETTITLQKVRLVGLDTFTKFDPLLRIGNYTFQNRLSWDELFFELDIVLDIKPSSLDDSIIEIPGSASIVENVKVKFGVQHLQATASFLLAIDQQALQDVRIGSLLKKDWVLPCFFSTIFRFEMSGFAMDAGNIVAPTIQGFVSPGMDRLVSGFADSAFLMYKDALLESMPSFFQTTLRDLINEKAAEQIKTYKENSGCPVARGTLSDREFVDFRDLLLSSEPYGDSISTVLLPLLQDNVIANDEDGFPALNSRLIRPITKLNSGEEGTLRFPSDLFHYVYEDFDGRWWPMLERFELRVFNVTIRNVDTFVEPLSVLDPTGANTVANEVNLGYASSPPLNVTISLRLSLTGSNDSPLNFENELDISLALPSTSCLLDVFAKVQERAFLDMQLKNVASPSCWLATIPYSGSETRLTMSKFALSLASISFGAKCTLCPGAGEAALSEILEVLDEAGMATTLLGHVEETTGDMVWAFYDSLKIDENLSAAPRLCPSNAEYDPTAVPILSEFIPPRASIEALLAACALAVESFAIASAKSHILRAPEPSDPLSTQASFVIPDGYRILDWSNLGEYLGDWADAAMDTARRYLGDVVESRDGEGTTDLGANVLLRGSLLNEDGVLEIPLERIIFEFAGLNFEATSVRIHGLDSISKVHALEPIANQTLQSRFEFQSLQMLVDFDITNAQDVSLLRRAVDTTTLSIRMSDILLDFSFLLALDMNKLEQLEIGSVMSVKKLVNCFLSVIHKIDVTQLTAFVGEVESLKVDGFLSPELASSLEPLLKALNDYFGTELIDAMPLITDSTLRVLMNGIVHSLVDMNSDYIPIRGESFPGFVDFRDLLLPEVLSSDYGGSGNSPYGDVFRSVYSQMSERLLSTDGDDAIGINGFLGSWTKGLSNKTGSVSYEGDLVNTTASIKVGGLDANLEIKLWDAHIENLDSFGAPLALMQPVFGQPNSLNNSLSFGVGPTPLRLAAKIMVGLSDNADLRIRNELDIRLDLGFVRVFLSIMLRIAEAPFLSFPLRDISNAHCWLATMFAKPYQTQTEPESWDYASVAVNDHSVSVDHLDLNASCISCTSPDFDRLILQLYSFEGSDNATNLVNNVLMQVGRVVDSDFFKKRLLDDASRQCPHHPAYDPDAAFQDPLSNPAEFFGFEDSGRDKKSLYFTVANAIFAAGLCFLVILWRFVILRRWNQKRLGSLSSEDAIVLAEQQRLESDLEVKLIDSTSSMFQSPNFPRHVRFLVPFVLVMDIGLYLGGHLGVISNVNIAARVAGESIFVNRFLDFSFIGSTARTYENGGNELAVLVFIFSGLWPYLKLVSSLVLFFLPPAKLGVSKRGTMLLWLDVFSKLSVVDIFAVLLAIAALLIYVGGPDERSSNEGEPFYVKLVVVPRGGFYCLLIAQRISRISSRFLLDYHRKIVDLGTREYNNTRSRHVVDLGLASATTMDACETLPEMSQLDNDYDAAESQTTVNRRGLQLEIHENTFADEYNTVDAWNSCRAIKPNDKSRGLFRLSGRCRRCISVGGTTGLVLTGLTILSLGIIGAILAPSISVETKPLWDVVESGNTYEEAVTDYTVFRIVCLVLLQARFILTSATDYIGLGFLLVVAITSAVLFPLMQFFSSVRRWWKTRKNQVQTTMSNRETKLAQCLERFSKWKYVEVYVFAFVIACWQLGAMSMYAIHHYCDFLGKVYGMLEYIGIADQSSVECFAVQASHPSTILIILGAFILLLAAFLYSAAVQVRRNKVNAMSLVISRTSVATQEGINSEMDETASHHPNSEPPIDEKDCVESSDKCSYGICVGLDSSFGTERVDESAQHRIDADSRSETDSHFRTDQSSDHTYVTSFGSQRVAGSLRGSDPEEGCERTRNLGVDTLDEYKKSGMCAENHNSRDEERNASSGSEKIEKDGRGCDTDENSTRSCLCSDQCVDDTSAELDSSWSGERTKEDIYGTNDNSDPSSIACLNQQCNTETLDVSYDLPSYCKQIIEDDSDANESVEEILDLFFATGPTDDEAPPLGVVSSSFSSYDGESESDSKGSF